MHTFASIYFTANTCIVLLLAIRTDNNHRMHIMNIDYLNHPFVPEAMENASHTHQQITFNHNNNVDHINTCPNI